MLNDLVHRNVADSAITNSLNWSAFSEFCNLANLTPMERNSGLLHELRLELHRTKAVDLAVDVVIAFDQANVLHFRADLEHRG